MHAFRTSFLCRWINFSTMTSIGAGVMEWVADSRLGCLPSLMVSTHSPFVFIGLNMNPILLPGVPESGRGVNKSYLSFRYPKKSPTSISRGFFSFNYKVLSIENCLFLNYCSTTGTSTVLVLPHSSTTLTRT